MAAQNAEHGAFIIERLIDASPSQVYAAFATAEGKERWFSAPPAKVLKREFDFRVGGRDRLVVQWPPGSHAKVPKALTTDFRAEYWDIVPQRRIVYVYEMYLDEHKISVSLATVEFQPHEERTRLIIHEQGVFLDGYRDEGARERGTNDLTDKLVASLGATDQRVHHREITLTRMIFAPRELVFQAWTDPGHLARWFGPEGFTVSDCRVDARVGGKWRLTMRANDELARRVGRDHPAGGEYLEVEKPSRLVFTNNALDAGGQVILEGLTTVTFEELGGATRMTLRTRAAGTGERVPFMLGGMEQGWSESLTKLGAAMAARGGPGAVADAGHAT